MISGGDVWWLLDGIKTRSLTDIISTILPICMVAMVG